MARSNIAYIDISFFAHATEDQNKVLEAAKNIVTKDYIEQVSFSRSNLKGEYGNPITFFKTKIREIEAIEALCRRISSDLSPLDKGTILHELNMHLTEGSLYIRLDKQEAFMGRLELCKADPIRIRLRFRTSKQEQIKQICQEIGILP